MRKYSLFLAVGLLLAFGWAETPHFTGPEFINDAGVAIDVGYYGAPVMFDWDLDGHKDLVCGQFTSGMIRLYLNIGPDSAPEFSGYSFFEASGSQIVLPSG